MTDHRIQKLEQQIAAAYRTEKELRSQVRRLEHMERISSVIRKAHDLEQMLSQVMEVVLDIFQSDRAWLLYPCDPDAPFWRVPVERTRSEFPGANSMNINVSMTPDVAGIFRAALETDGPVTYGAGGLPLEENTKSFGVRSQMSMAIYPRVGKPWQFGIHQCSQERLWTEEEKLLYRDVGHRIADALTNLLFSRDLQMSRAALHAAHTTLEKRIEERSTELLDANKKLKHEVEMRKQTELGLRDALKKVKQLSGFLPICASCKKIRDDHGYWSQIEVFIRSRSEAEFSHSICPDCTARLYPGFAGSGENDEQNPD